MLWAWGCHKLYYFAISDYWGSVQAHFPLFAGSWGLGGGAGPIYPVWALLSALLSAIEAMLLALVLDLPSATGPGPGSYAPGPCSKTGPAPGLKYRAMPRNIVQCFEY